MLQRFWRLGVQYARFGTVGLSATATNAVLFVMLVELTGLAPLLANAVELQKDVPEFHNNLGMALEHTGRFTAAATAYTDALTADPSYEKAKLNLARVEAVKRGPEEPFAAIK